MRQHHPGAADTDAPGRGGDGGDQDLGRGSGLAGGGVVLGQPIPVVAKRLAMLGEGDALADRVIRRTAGHDSGLVEHGKRELAHRRIGNRVILAGRLTTAMARRGGRGRGRNLARSSSKLTAPSGTMMGAVTVSTLIIPNP